MRIPFCRVLLLAVFLLVNNSASAQPTNVPVAYYPFNGNADDATGNGNNGEIFNISFTPARLGLNGGKSIRFNPTGSFVQIPHSALLDIYGNSGLSIAFWVRFDQIEPLQAIVNKWGPGDNEDDQFWVALQGGKIRFMTDEELTEIFSASQLNSNQWHQISCVYNPKILRIQIYLDGELNIEKPLFHFVRRTNQRVIIGNSSFENIPLMGELDDLRIYNNPLSAQSVQSLYKMESLPRPSLLIVQPGFLQCVVEPGLQYQLENSADLKSWNGVNLPFISNDVVYEMQVPSSAVQMFYRLKQI